MIILGVDPGLQNTGYAVLQSEHNMITILKYGYIKTISAQPFELRLKIIFDEICDIINKFPIDALALEEVFYSKNVKIALKMGHVRGVTLLAAANHRIATAEYSPREIKQAITGNGNASKHQVQQMVVNVLKLSSAPSPFDITDAIAVAYCHSQRSITIKKMS